MLSSLLRITAISVLSATLIACDNADSPSSWNEYASVGAYSAAISADGKLAIMGAQQEGGSLWDIQRNARLFDWNEQKGKKSIVSASGFSADGRFAVTANQQSMVLWHTDTGKPEWFWSSPGEILDIALSNDGQFALLGLGNHQAVYFDIQRGGIKHTFYHQGRVNSVALSQDSKTLLTGSDDYKTTLWNRETGEQLFSLTLDNVIDVVALSPDGKTAFSSSNLDKAVIWDSSSGKIKHTLASQDGFFPKRVSYVAAKFSTDGSKLLTGTSSGLIQLWSSNSGKELKRWRAHKRDAYGANSTSIYAVGFSNNKYFAIGSNGFINILQ